MCNSHAKASKYKARFFICEQAWDKAALYMLIFKSGSEGSLKITPLAPQIDQHVQFPCEASKYKARFFICEQAWDKAALYMLIFTSGSEGSLKITP